MPSPNGRSKTWQEPVRRAAARRWLTDAELAASHAVEWEEVVPHELVNAVAAVTAIGAAIMFSQSADGGVLRVQIYDGDDRPKWWIRDADDLTQLLRHLAQIAAGSQPGAEHPANGGQG